MKVGLKEVAIISGIICMGAGLGYVGRQKAISGRTILYSLGVLGAVSSLTAFVMHPGE